MKGFIEVTKRVWEVSDEYKEKFCSFQVQIDKNITDEEEIKKAIKRKVRAYRYENGLVDVTRTDYSVSQSKSSNEIYFVSLYSNFKMLLSVDKIIKIEPFYDKIKHKHTTNITFIEDSSCNGIEAEETYEEIKQKIKEAQGE